MHMRTTKITELQHNKSIGSTKTAFPVFANHQFKYATCNYDDIEKSHQR